MIEFDDEMNEIGVNEINEIGAETDGIVMPGETADVSGSFNDEYRPTPDDQNSLLMGQAIGSMVPPKISLAIAGAAYGNYHAGNSGALIGGLIGYLLGQNLTHDPAARATAIRSVLNAGSDNGRNAHGENYDGVSGTGGGIMSAYDLMNYTYQKYGFSGRWGDFVGQPSIKFHAMIYGRPKQGKSILAFQWAKYLSENFGRVLYVASEEGFSVTLQKKVVDFATDNNNLDFANFRDFQQIRSAVSAGDYRFVFIDSVNYIRITPEDVELIKEENPRTAFITIQQATKSGQFRGSQQFAHNCDIIIQVEAGVAYHQGRFQEGTEMQVFDGPEKNQNAQNTESASGAGVQGQMIADDYGQMELSF